MSTIEVFICFLNCRWVVHFLTQLAWPCLLIYPICTSCEFKLDQNPVESARKVKTQPESLIQIPKQTSASHILLYSYAFFIRPFFQQSFICWIDFLCDAEVLHIFCLSEVSVIILTEGSQRSYLVSINISFCIHLILSFDLKNQGDIYIYKYFFF